MKSVAARLAALTVLLGMRAKCPCGLDGIHGVAFPHNEQDIERFRCQRCGALPGRLIIFEDVPPPPPDDFED